MESAIHLHAYITYLDWTIKSFRRAIFHFCTETYRVIGFKRFEENAQDVTVKSKTGCGSAWATPKDRKDLVERSSSS